MLANINESLKPDFGVVMRDKIGKTLAQGDEYHNKNFQSKIRMNRSIYKNSLNNGHSF